jgi:4-alpha-glucanotransferase
MTPLQELADAFGIELTRPTADGSFAAVPDETLVALCRALGASLRHPDDASAELAGMRAAHIAAGIEPVAVAWDDAAGELTLYGTADRVDAAYTVTVELDTGETVEWPHTVCRTGEVRDAGHGSVAFTIVLPHALPHGAHRVQVVRGGRRDTATLLAAPRRPRPRRAGRRWGVFAPLYALHDDVSPATGDLGTLQRLADWAAPHGATIVGTLPLLATFLGHGAEPCDPSPYAPVSRRFWNEVYLDTTSILGAAHFEEPVPREFVDLPARAARLRAVLEPLARAAETDPDLHRWLAWRPDVTEYAEFRSEVEGGNAAAVRYHEFVQWQCDRQLEDLAARLDARAQALYLDFPIGTHRNGFDVETEPDLFVRDASVGAPPDAFFAGGQNWGFPPLDPHAARRSGHAHLRACLDAHLRFARVLRLDHVMGLHRLWFVPEGAAATEGAYVHYAAEEQWAAVCLVAARHGAEIVGEDLGTVPDAARHALDEHGALGMWVVQFETPEHGAVVSPRAEQLACTSTHDLAPFAAWWQALDADRRTVVLATLQASGDLDPGDATPRPADVLGAVYAWMSRSDAPLVLASLEDLWLETEPQNRPGTPSSENFRRRNPFAIDQLDAIPDLPTLLTRLGSGRRSTPA